jgi:amidophosphoribosyltransferase
MCGIIGILNPSGKPVFEELYRGLHAIQHRGQDAAGILTFSNRFHLVKGQGLVRDVFKVEEAEVLKGNIGIGHVRYPTVGVGSWEDAQPFWTSTPYGIGIVHNGNVTNFYPLKEHFRNVHRSHINSDCDVEGLLCLMGDELLSTTSRKLTHKEIFAAIKGVLKRAKGSYSVVGQIVDHGMYAFRDPYGIRPIIMGTREEEDGSVSHCFASESVVLDLLDFHNTRNLLPGEAVFVEMDGTCHSEVVLPEPHRPCIFEYVYFARPDSFIDGISVYKTRQRLGEKLAEKWKETGLTADIVVPVPESATTAAAALSAILNVPYREALVKNRYIGRTFIMPRNSVRRDSVRLKLNPIQIEFEDRRVLLVDDSIVRGNTSRSIVSIARKAGAKKVYMASYSPPLKYPCVYGIDMSRKKEFVAKGRDVDEIARAIGADHLVYQDLPDLEDAAREGNEDIEQFCTACFSGGYPTGDVTDETLKIIAQDRENNARSPRRQ